MAEKGDPDKKKKPDWLDEIDDAELVVFYAHEDEYRISKTILHNFEENNIKYVHPAAHFEPGKLEYVDVAKAIGKSKKTLIILSKKRKEHLQFSLETYLALEQGLRTNQMTVMILLIDGMTREDVSTALPLLQNACQMELFDNLHERCMEELCRAVTLPPIALNTLLPAGNFAVGMAWSHFAGYLKTMLPALPEAIKKSEFFEDNLGHMSTCFFMLCPLSARGQKRISDNDDNVEYMGSVEIPDTYFKPSIYKVKRENEKGKTEEYLVCAEYPNAMLAIGHICDQALALLTPEQRRLEVERFRYKIEEIINHHNNAQCIGRAKCIVYDDESKGDEATPSYQLSLAAKEAISEGCSRPLVDSAYRPVVRGKDGKLTDVCFLFCDHSHDDKRTLGRNPDQSAVTNIRTHLEDKGLKCSLARVPVDPHPEIEERVRTSRWIAVLLSRDTLRYNDMMDSWLVSLMKLCIEENKLRVLVLLRDLEPENIPDFIQWVTYIDIQREPYYKDKIADIIQGVNVSMDSRVPVGDVSFGLAWAFHVNYLRHVLPDITARIEEKVYSPEMRKLQVGVRENKLSKFLLEIVTLSCRFHPVLTEIDCKIEGPYRVQEKEKDIGGTKQRIFPCNLYRIQTPSCDYYFAGEVLSPLKALKAMNESQIGGLSPSQMATQRDRMVTQIKAILGSDATPESMQKKCKLVKYDDLDKNRRPLSEVIKDEIDREGSASHIEKYAEWLKQHEEN